MKHEQKTELLSLRAIIDAVINGFVDDKLDEEKALSPIDRAKWVSFKKQMVEKARDFRDAEC